MAPEAYGLKAPGKAFADASGLFLRGGTVGGQAKTLFLRTGQFAASHLLDVNPVTGLFRPQPGHRRRERQDTDNMPQVFGRARNRGHFFDIFRTWVCEASFSRSESEQNGAVAVGKGRVSALHRLVCGTGLNSASGGFGAGIAGVCVLFFIKKMNISSGTSGFRGCSVVRVEDKGERHHEGYRIGVGLVKGSTGS